MATRSTLSIVTSLLVCWALTGCGGASTEDDLPARMLDEHRNDSAVASPEATATPASPVVGSAVTYGELDGSTLEGYLALPRDDERPTAALIVIHEWWGLNDNIRSMTRRLAGEGYVALAVDLYEGRTADDADAAHELMRESTRDPLRLERNLALARDWLVAEQGATSLGTIGWCFGGGWSLNAAMAMPTSVDATVIFYGRLETDRERLADLRAPVLGLFGGQDHGIPIDSVRAFETTMRELGREVEIVVYDEAGHAFANPTGLNHDPTAAADAWTRVTTFLATNLR